MVRTPIDGQVAMKMYIIVSNVLYLKKNGSVCG